MFRRRSSRSDSTGASAYSRRDAVADSAWALQDRVRSGAGAALEAGAGGLGRAFERVAFPLQERLVWPLSDRAAAMGATGRAVSFGAVILLAAAAGVAGLVWAAPDGPHGPTAGARVALSAVPAGAAKAVAARPPEPTLHGAAPVFKPAAGTGASQIDPAKAIVKSSPAASSDAPASSSSASSSTSSPAAGASAAKTAAVDGPPAGPAAIAAARDFATAFVVYETGGIDADVRGAFGKTATPELARALLRRPPRLPANVKVPRAKVLNVVPAPSHGDVYPVSVSLLRVGVTSELRLEMEERKGRRWRVTNVLG
jgi:hypothetical protein